jgi:F-type H+-transporting ATPase subunit epsilon
MRQDHTFQVDVVTPARTVYSDRVVAINVMAWDGYVGVLANHAPLLEQLGTGELRLTEANGGEVTFAISGGFMEVGPDRTIILADAAERPAEIDVERARAAQERADARSSGRLDTPDLDVGRAKSAYARATNRLKMAGAPPR